MTMSINIRTLMELFPLGAPGSVMMCIGFFLVMFRMPIGIVGTGKSFWEKETEGIIYRGNIQFVRTVSHNMKCAIECNEYGELCSAFSIIPSNMTCIGYGELNHAEEALGVQLWTRIGRCRRIDYVFIRSWQKCIKIYSTPLDWNEASLACKAGGGALLRFDNQENISDLPVPSDSEFYWVGAYDYGVDGWRWESGVPVTSNYWKPGEPNNGVKCGLLSKQHKLHDFFCDRKQKYICQD